MPDTVGKLLISALRIWNLIFNKGGRAPGAPLYRSATVIVLFSLTFGTLNITNNNGRQSVPLCILYGMSGNIILSVSTAIIGSIHFLAVLIIPSLYLHVIHLLRKADLHRKENVSSAKDHLTQQVLVQLILVNISNVICWLPSSIVMFLSLAYKKYPIELLFIVVLVLTPTNSVLNPCILRFSKMNFCQNVAKIDRYNSKKISQTLECNVKT